MISSLKQLRWHWPPNRRQRRHLSWQSPGQAYKSRIDNYAEIKQLMAAHGFVEKHAEDYSASALIGLLSK